MARLDNEKLAESPHSMYAEDNMKLAMLWSTLAVALIGAGNRTSAAEPISQTTRIVAVVPELAHLQKWDDMQGDTADPFWADDDCLYHFTCDGRGFGKEQRNLCFNKLTGPDLLQHKDPPEAAQLLHSLLAYAASEKFAPTTTIDLITLRRIMGILVIHA